VKQFAEIAMQVGTLARDFDFGCAQCQSAVEGIQKQRPGRTRL